MFESLSTKEVVLENQKMHAYLDALQAYTEASGILGYAIARNIRILQNELVEYQAKYSQYAEQYGKPVLDADGKETGNLQLTGENLTKFKQAIMPFATINHKVTLCTVPYESCVDLLTAKDFIKLDFMFNTPLECSSNSTTDTYDRIIDTLPDGTNIREARIPISSVQQ